VIASSNKSSKKSNYNSRKLRELVYERIRSIPRLRSFTQGERPGQRLG
jgi:hypothetical protein